MIAFLLVVFQYIYNTQELYVNCNTYWIIKTHGSELRGQEEAVVHDERVSYLHVAPP